LELENFENQKSIAVTTSRVAIIGKDSCRGPWLRRVPGGNLGKDEGAPSKGHLLICDCEGSMVLDGDKLGQGMTGFACNSYTNLCRSEAEAAVNAFGTGQAVTIACGQEAAFFQEIADEQEAGDRLSCVDIRDRAGWSDQGAEATPKMLALLAEAEVARPSAPAMPITSEGVCLVYGSGQTALDAAARLAEVLSVTCILTDAGDALPRRSNDFPIHAGTIASATGSLSRFEIRVDGFADVEPGGRGGLRFGKVRDGAMSECDIILDLSGGSALFSAHEKRDGYLRADPGDPIAIEKALFDASQLIGTFDKPIYVRFEQSLCAHSRASQPGCTRCLEVCPTGAITPNGDHVAIDPYICAGCGACASVCPTGAATYDDPPFAALMRRVQVLAETYRGAGGEAPELLVHDDSHGADMIALAARFGRGLPAHVVPLDVHEIAGFSHQAMLAALAIGFARVTLLAGPKTQTSEAQAQVDLANGMAVAARPEGGPRARLIDPMDPDGLSDALYDDVAEAIDVSPILPLGDARAIVRTSMVALAGDAVPDAPVALEGIEVSGGVPYGTVDVNKDACTLCLACVSLCPTGALGDNPDKPELRFQEDACVQCGICANTCPENAITLEPRYHFGKEALSHRTVHAEEPFACIECGSEFGVKSTVEKVMEKLEGKHWMFTDSHNSRLIMMCDDCRVNAQFQSGDAPFKLGTPRQVRTTDDYLSGKVDDES
jgi:ferredoxin